MTETAGPNTPILRRPCRPSTIEALKEDLERQRAFSPQFIERHFRDAAARGSIEYKDIDELTLDQADAMSYSLAKSIRSFKKDAGRARARGVGFLKDQSNDSEGEQFEIKAKQYAAALKDLCDAYGLDAPL
jgi:hypothetical protein